MSVFFCPSCVFFPLLYFFSKGGRLGPDYANTVQIHSKYLNQETHSFVHASLHVGQSFSFPGTEVNITYSWSDQEKAQIGLSAGEFCGDGIVNGDEEW